MWSRPQRDRMLEILTTEWGKPYYCDECEANVTRRETKARIQWTL